MAAVSDLSPGIFESERENLMKKLLDAVKQCQVQFGGKQELATEKHSCVQCLLAQFERTFLHGLKRGKVWSALSSLSEPFRHVTSRVLQGIPDSEITFWPFVKEHMSPSEIQRYFTMSSINTDSGRCRSWLRSCLNEASLEREFVAILADRRIIRQFYEDSALFLDEERSSTLPAMARGLGSIFFAIDIDNSQLNLPFKQPSLPRANAALAPVESKSKNEPRPLISDNATVVADPSIINKKKRKKKVKQATIEDIEFPEDEPPSGIYAKPEPQNSTKLSQVKELTTGELPGKVADKLTDFGRPFANSSLKEVDSVKTHRRATSLESSEIIRQKQDRYRMALNSSVDFEAPSIGLARNEAIATDNSTNNMTEKKQKNDQKTSGTGLVLDIHEEADPKEDPEYTNILSKLASLSTSFKNSLSTGFFQRDQGTKGDNHNENTVSRQKPTTINNEQDEYIDLLDDENDAISRTLKLEMRQDVNESLGSKEDTRQDNFLIGDIEGKRRYQNKQTSEEESDVTTQKGLILPSESTLENAEKSKALETPWPTVADNGAELKQNGELNSDRVALSSAGMSSAQNNLEGGAIADVFTDNCIRPFTIESKKEIEDNAFANGSVSNDKMKSVIQQDDIDRLSFNSSNASSVCDDSESLQPAVGFEGGSFSSIVMSYDRQSSQAASDTLQLLKNAAEINFSQDSEHGKENDKQYERLPRHHGNTRTAVSSNGGDLSSDELKQVILATAKRKDELEEKNRVLQLALDEERELSLSLKTEVETLSDNLEELEERSKRETTDLSRENEILRNQLKKYVSAVQLLKRENENISKETNDAISTLRGYSDASEVILPQQLRERMESEMDSIYEEKLVQMAQLHGELMEFHEMLQRDLVKKERIITKIKEELVVLRGPLPDDIDAANKDYERKAHEHRPLINVWIPSVFIQGKGSDAHHLYQIYIRIGDEEWNIYRRYSQFHRMHMMSSKISRDVENLSFPPKKILGKKDIKFVEGRRKKLQDYIRKLINISLANDTALSESPNKENLEKSLPFFCDEFCSDGKSRKESSKKKSKRPTVYTGL